MKFFYYLSKLYWIGLIGLIGTFISSSPIFKILCTFSLFVFVNILIDFAMIKCSILQIIGIIKLYFQFGDSVPTIDNFETMISYSLPFKGKWVAVNGCVKEEYSHSWNIPTQRYAYDFVILDDNNCSYYGEETEITSYYCYSKEILAPADGVVVEIKNNSKDSILLGKGKFIPRSKHIAGNYIVIRHAQNEYSTLAHLKKDSFVVNVGDKVSKGQVVALCGNTGNSTEPHLHFQLQNGQSFYSSVGLPIKFHSILVTPKEGYENYDKRSHMKYGEILEGYVTRGFCYENNE